MKRIDREHERAHERGLELLARSRELLAERNIEASRIAAIEARDSLEGCNCPGDLGDACLQIGRLGTEACNFADALEHYRRATSLYHEARDRPAEATSRRLVGATQRMLGIEAGALDELLEALRLFRLLEQPVDIGMTLGSIAAHYTHVGDYELSLTTAIEGMEILSGLPIEDHGVRRALTEAYQITAAAYFNGENYSAAMQWQQRALDIADDDMRGYLYNDLGATSSLLGDHRSALRFYKRGYQAARQAPHPKVVAIATSALNLGNQYIGRKNFPTALLYLSEARGLFEQAGQRDRIAGCMVDIARVHRRMGNPRLARPLLKKALALAIESRNAQVIEWAHDGLQHYYIEERNYERALFHFRESQVIHEAHVNLATLSRMESLHLRYEQERQLKLDEIRQRHDVVNAAIQAQESERSRIARDLHDGVGQMLAAARLNMIRLRDLVAREQAVSNGTEGLAVPLARAIEIIDRSSADLRAISHTLGASTVRELGLVVALAELLTHLEAHGATRFVLSAVAMEDRMPDGHETGLFRIAQELIANVLTHAAATEATVQIVRDRDEIRLTVEDNGRGYSPTEARCGMGRTNIAARAAAMSGTVEYDSTPGHGTTVTVVVGLPE